MKVCLLLVWVFISATVAITEECAGEDQCLSAVQEFKTYKDLIPWAPDFDGDNFCRAASGDHYCIATPRYQCPDTKYALFKTLYDFYCNNYYQESLIRLERVKWTKCCEDEDFRQRVFTNIKNTCGPEFQNNYEQLQAQKMDEFQKCQFAMAIQSCVQNVMFTECSMDVASLLNDIYMTVGNKFLISCSEELEATLAVFQRFIM